MSQDYLVCENSTISKPIKEYKNIKAYKKHIRDMLNQYKSYLVDKNTGKVTYANPKFNLLQRYFKITDDKILFCPQLLDEENFVQFQKYIVDKHCYSVTNPSYRKALYYLVTFSFLSMLIYSFACSNRQRENAVTLFPLSNWIPKSIMTDITYDEETQSFQRVYDDNGEISNWCQYSTVRFIRTSEECQDKKSRVLRGNIISDYIHVADVAKTMIVPITKYNENGEPYIDTRRVGQNSLYTVTDKFWDLVEKARNNELTFVTISRNKIKNEWLKHKKSANSPTSTVGNKKTGDIIDAIYYRHFDNDYVKRHRGWRKIGEAFPECSFQVGTLKGLQESEEYVPATVIELYIRSFFDTELGVKLGDISLDIDKFFETPREECDFSDTEGVDETTYFEFKPEVIIQALKENTITPKYEDYILYDAYKILDNCKVHNGKYYCNIDYVRQENGRFYTAGSCIQNMPKELRKLVFSEYKSVDMNCGVYSLMLNIGKKLNYKGNVSEIEKMVKDRKAYRMNLVDEKLGITYEDVKEKLTMISFGCKLDPEKMMETSYREAYYDYYGINPNTGVEYYSNGKRYIPYHSCLYRKCEPQRMINIAKWCNKPEVVELHNEINKLGKFILKKYTKKNSNGKNILVNGMGNIIEFDKSSRHSFGQKLAFIYQCEESIVLKSILDNFKIGRKKAGNIKGGIGLLLHDAVYIHKDLLKKHKNIEEKMSEYVKGAFGYDIRYEVE